MSKLESSAEVICVTRGSRPSAAPHINLCNLLVSILGGNDNVHDDLQDCESIQNFYSEATVKGLLEHFLITSNTKDTIKSIKLKNIL